MYVLKSIKIQGSNRNLRKSNEPKSQDALTNQGVTITLKINS